MDLINLFVNVEYHRLCRWYMTSEEGVYMYTKDSYPILSIIVPVYNAQCYLEKCIRSLTNQSLRNIEIILINDASTDSSLQMMKQFASEDPRIKIIDSPFNEGVSLTRNKGLMSIIEGKSLYVAFVDSDDWVESDRYKRLCAVAEGYDCDAVLDGINYVDPSGAIVKTRRQVKQKRNSPDFIYDHEIVKSQLNGSIAACTPWNGIYKLSIIRDHGLCFQHMRGEDTVFNIEFYALAHKVGLVYECGYNYRGMDKSLSRGYIPPESDWGLAGLKRTAKYLLEHPWLRDKVEDYEKPISLWILAEIVSYCRNIGTLAHERGFSQAIELLEDISSLPAFRCSYEKQDVLAGLGIRKRIFARLLYNKRVRTLALYLYFKYLIYTVMDKRSRF